MQPYFQKPLIAALVIISFFLTCCPRVPSPPEIRIRWWERCPIHPAPSYRMQPSRFTTR